MPAAQIANNAQASTLTATTAWNFVSVTYAQIGLKQYQVVTLSDPTSRRTADKEFKIDTNNTGVEACPRLWNDTIQCRARFATRGQLKAHQQVCHDYLPFLCPGCDEPFADSTNCRKHSKDSCDLAQRIGVPQKDLIPCDHVGCPYKNKRADNLKRHKRNCKFPAPAPPASGLLTPAASAAASATPSPTPTVPGADRRQTAAEEHTEEAPPSPDRQRTQPPADNSSLLDELPFLQPLEHHWQWEGSFNYGLPGPQPDQYPQQPANNPFMGYPELPDADAL